MFLRGGILLHFVFKFFLFQVVICEIIRLKDGETIFEYDDQSKPLGKGNFGWVFKGTRKQGHKTLNVAFKEQRNFDILNSEAFFLHEVDIYKSIGSHHSIPTLYYYKPATNESRAVIVSELLGETLGQLRKKLKGFSIVTVMRIGLKMLNALEHIHRKGIIHCDVMVDNIAVGFDDNSNIYLFDFGVSKEYTYQGGDVDYRRNDIISLSRTLIAIEKQRHLEFLSPKNETHCEHVLCQFSLNSLKHGKIDYNVLRKILIDELVKHSNEPNFDKFDWQTFDIDEKMDAEAFNEINNETKNNYKRNCIIL